MHIGYNFRNLDVEEKMEFHVPLTVIDTSKDKVGMLVSLTCDNCGLRKLYQKFFIYERQLDRSNNTYLLVWQGVDLYYFKSELDLGPIIVPA